MLNFGQELYYAIERQDADRVRAILHPITCPAFENIRSNDGVHITNKIGVPSFSAALTDPNIKGALFVRYIITLKVREGFLQLFAKQGAIEHVRLLLQWGWDVSREAKIKAKEYADNEGHTEVAKLISDNIDAMPPAIVRYDMNCSAHSVSDISTYALYQYESTAMSSYIESKREFSATDRVHDGMKAFRTS